MKKILLLSTLFLLILFSNAKAQTITSFTGGISQACPYLVPGQFGFSVSGGTSPYTYTISDLSGIAISGSSATGNEILPTHVNSTTYTLTITDGGGATTSSITNPLGGGGYLGFPYATTTITNSDCNNFEITMTPDGGYTPQMSSFIGGGFSSSFPPPTSIVGNVITYSPLPDNASFSIIEVGVGGCSYQVYFSNPLSLDNTVYPTNPTVYGLNNGSITMPKTYTGVTSTYTFSYSMTSSLTGSTTFTPILIGSDFKFNNLFAGTYTITQTSSPSSCIRTRVITLVDPPNLVTGTAKIDLGGGCGALDPPALINTIVSNGTTNVTAVSNTAGLYLTGIPAYSYTITPSAIYNPSYYTISPTSPVINFPPAVSPATQNFCLTPVSLHHNLAIAIYPYGANRPGFNTGYQVAITNTGNQVDNGCFTFTYDNIKQTFVSASFTPSSSTSSSISYCTPSINPMETKYYNIVLLNAIPPTVNDGDYINVSASITMNTNTDEDLLNNTTTSTRIVRNSYDPNNKICAQGDTIFPSQIGNNLNYTINFENTGSAPAVNITVRDFINLSQYDLTTLVPSIGSAPFTTTIIPPNEVNFTFANINLPATPGSNTGFVTFSIKPKSTLIKGDSVKNNANIYFDFNQAVITDYSVTHIDSNANCIPITASTTINDSIVCEGDSIKINTIINGVLNPTIGYTYTWYDYSSGVWNTAGYNSPNLIDVAGGEGIYLLAIEVVSVAGCKDTSYFSLNISEPTSDTLNIDNCGPYTWTNGTTYSASGYYTQNFTNIGGCDSNKVLNLIIDSTICPTVPPCQNTFVQSLAGLADTTNNGFTTVSAANIFPAPDGVHFYVTGLKNDSTAISYFDAGGTRIWTDVFKYDTLAHQIKDMIFDAGSGDIIAVAAAGNQGSAFRYSTTSHSIIWANTYNKSTWNNYFNIHSLNTTQAIITSSKTGNVHSFLIDKNTGAAITSGSGGYALSGMGGEYYSILDNNILYGACRRYYTASTDFRASLFAQNATTGAFLWGNSIISNGPVTGGSDTRMYPVAPIKDADSLVVLASGNLTNFGSFLTNSQDLVVAKTSNVGIETWTKQYTVTGNPANYDRPTATAIKNTANGYYMVGNYYNGALSFKHRGFVIKTDKQGNVLWAKQLGIGNTRNEISNVTEMGGALFVTMSSNSYSSTSNDLLVVKLNVNDYSDTTCDLIKILPITATNLAPVNNSFTYTTNTSNNTLITQTATPHSINVATTAQCATCCPLDAQIMQTNGVTQHCPNIPVVLNTIINGVTNPTGGFTYQWFTNNLAYSIILATTPSFTDGLQAFGTVTTYAVIITSLNGLCKDTVTTSIAYNDLRTRDTLVVSTCKDTLWNGIAINSAGYYTYTGTNIYGCDSVKVLNYISTAFNASILSNGSTFCSNDTANFVAIVNGSIAPSGYSYTWYDYNFGNFITPLITGSSASLTNQVGTFNIALIATNGICSDTTYESVTFNEVFIDTLSITQCAPYTWTNGIAYDSSGYYTQTFSNANGCDSIEILNLTISTTGIVCQTLDSINVSTGINTNGTPLTIGLAGGYDPNWKDSGALGPNLLPTDPIIWAWQLTPIAGTNAQWINLTGSNGYNPSSQVYGVINNTYTRDFSITSNIGFIIPQLETAADDSLTSIDIISPSGIVYPLTKPANGYSLLPVINPNVIPAEIGIWQIKARMWYFNDQSAFLLSGNILQQLCDTVCCPIALTDTMKGTIVKCLGDTVDIKAYVNGVYNDPNYTYQWYHSDILMPTYIPYTAAEGGNTANLLITSGTPNNLDIVHLVATNINGICKDTISDKSFIFFAPFTDTINVSACDSIVINNTTITNSGYYATLIPDTLYFACDTTRVINLTITKPVTDTTYIVNCNPTLWGVIMVVQSGIYANYFTAANGCDSIKYLNYTKASIVCDTTSINISTGIDISGNPLAVLAVDANWTEGISSTTLYTTPTYSPYWEPTPVLTTNARWINHSGTIGGPSNMSSTTIPFTMQRSFTVSTATGFILPNFGVTADDGMVSIELEDPSGIIYPLTIPVSPAYKITANVTSAAPIPAAIGVWKIRAKALFIDKTNAFLVSGFINIPHCDTVCCPITLTAANNKDTFCNTDNVTITSSINGIPNATTHNYQWHLLPSWIPVLPFFGGNTGTLNYNIVGATPEVITYAVISTNTNFGCKDTAYSTITILNKFASTLVIDTCRPYTWTNGITYNTTGIYNQSYTTNNGCDSIATLDFTIDTTLCHPCVECGIDSINLSTGVDNTNALQSAGASEMHWKLTNAPIGVSTGIQPIVSNSGSWSLPSGANWIVPQTVLGNNASQAGNYNYERQFEVCKTGKFLITYTSLADNSDSIFVDGNYISRTVGGAFGFLAANAAVANNYPILLTAGMHSIVAKVSNAGSITGFYFSGTIKPDTTNATGKLSADSTCCNYSNITQYYSTPVIINGILYTAAGNYSQLFTNAAGCDSTIEIDLSATSAPLAIADIKLNGIKNTLEQNELSWATHQQENTNYYTVQKSKDGNHFSNLFTVTNMAPNEKNNIYVDEKTNKESWFYRIQQVMKNGSSKLSNIVYLESKTGSNDLQLYPNPTVGNATASIFSLKNMQTELLIYSAQGALVQRINVQLAKGINTIDINLDALASGIYTVKIGFGNESIIKRITKL